ncbi:MAG: cell division protein FtsQ/DivIB [Alphaproteobacteria bacterium]
MRRLIPSRRGRTSGAGRRAGRRRMHWRPLRPGLRRLAVVGGAVLGFALIIGGGAWLWTSGRVTAALDDARGALVAASADAGLILREVYVSGRSQTSRADVLEAIGIRRGAPLVSLDPAAARRRLDALGWVRTATVERRFPDTVFVRLDERAPLALWQRKGRLVVVDREGVVVAGADPGDFAALPVIVGDDAPAHIAGLLAVMASEPALRARVEAAVRVGGRRWNLRLDNGIDVQLPEQGVVEAWRRLADFERRHRLLARDITAVDLRLPDRLVVVRPPPAGKGKST